MNKILGISGSLRNIRYDEGSDLLIEEINQIETKKHLLEYLEVQGQFCLGAFVEPNREKEQSFDKIFRDLKKNSGNRGLSNTECFLASALWGAKMDGAEIDHVSLSDFFFDELGKTQNLDVLFDKVQNADGIMLSSPVYFGDRGSLSHSFLTILRKQEKNSVKGKFFAGITAGAKRNGGQETCLIYKMQDFMELGMLGLGNDSLTTAQYGGTGHAGDIGTAAKDEYGLNTSIGTGKRMAEVLKIDRYSASAKLTNKPKIGIIILQDSKEKAKEYVEKYFLQSKFSNKADFRMFYFPDAYIKRCIACTACPTVVGSDKKYRCIIHEKEDLFVQHHQELIDLDAMLICGYSPRNFTDVKSTYQAFMERTRYLRRSDYVYSNLLVAPLVFQEVGNRENLQSRIVTSNIRHHTIMHKPIIFDLHKDQFIDIDHSLESMENFISTASKLTAGRIIYASSLDEYHNYQPVGYTLNTERDYKKISINNRQKNAEERKMKYLKQKEERIAE
jgi:multimeric flavodoxin WrbA